MCPSASPPLPRFPTRSKLLLCASADFSPPVLGVCRSHRARLLWHHQILQLLLEGYTLHQSRLPLPARHWCAPAPCSRMFPTPPTFANAFGCLADPPLHGRPVAPEENDSFTKEQMLSRYGNQKSSNFFDLTHPQTAVSSPSPPTAHLYSPNPPYAEPSVEPGLSPFPRCMQPRSFTCLGCRCAGRRVIYDGDAGDGDAGVG